MNFSQLLSRSITIFGFEIYWYAIIIVSGMFAAFLVISLLFRRRNMSRELFLTFFVICLPIAIVTTRVFFCITDGISFKYWFDFEHLRKGGLAITGGILGGAISVMAVCFFKKVNFFRAGDCIVVGLLLAQSIGRWGNFVNQEVYGGVVTNEALQFFPISVFIDAKNEWHYAFFFYESMITLTAAIVLFINAWKNPYKPNGINTSAYFMTYGLTRMIMEPLRDPEYILNGGDIRWSFVFAIVLFLGGLGMLTYVLLNNLKKEKKLLGSATGDPYGITKFIGDTKGETAYFDNVNMMCAVYPENYTVKTEEIEEEKEEDNVEENDAEKTKEDEE